MSGAQPVVAHLIVGGRAETYLSAALESISDFCDHAVINDTSGEPQSVNLPVIEKSRFAREGRLTLVRTLFRDFSAARNVCIDKTPAAYSGAWALVVDADEVHGEDLPAVEAILPKLPREVDAVDGYLRHFVGSFAWWIELNRTRLLFRLAPARRWHGKIHERVAPLHRKVALPAVWFHYGHVTLPREEAKKGRLYASLGQSDRAPSEKQMQNATPSQVWPPLLRRAIRYRGPHPVAVRDTITELNRERAQIFAEVDSLAAKQTALERLRNQSRRLNADRLLAWRLAQAWMRWGWRPQHALPAQGCTRESFDAQRLAK
jgi:hypothetical protein